MENAQRAASSIYTIIMIRTLVCVLLLSLAAMPLSAQRKRALLVGVSAYKQYPWTGWDNIHGKEDIDLLTPELKKKGFSVSVITNGRATYKGVITALQSLLRQTAKGDIVYLHFSCHGQPVEDGLRKGFPANDEKDGWDEALIPIDAGRTYGVKGYKGNSHLIDDELERYVCQLRRRVGRSGYVYVVTDACHAGDMSRAGFETIRGTNEGFTANPNNKYNPPRENGRVFSMKRYADEGRMAPAVYLEACRSRERNAEVRYNSREHGPLTLNVCLALRGMRSFGKEADIFVSAVENSVRQKGRWPKTQTMVIERSNR